MSPVRTRPVARSLFPISAMSDATLDQVKEAEVQICSNATTDDAFSFMAQCDKKKARHHKIMAPMPVVETSVRRCTRGSVRRDGYKPVFQELQSQPEKKKPRCKPFTATLLDDPQDKDDAVMGANDGANLGGVPPPTPIKSIQEIGLDLGIAAEKLTMERLMANLDEGTNTTADD